MGPRHNFLGTFIQIEIDDVMVMTHGFGVFESCLWMALLTMDKMKISQNALTAFFRLIYKNQGFEMKFHYGQAILKSKFWIILSRFC